MIGVNGLEEKGINLQIAVKLKDSLEKQGFSVIMTREEDKGLYEEDSRNQKAQDNAVQDCYDKEIQTCAVHKCSSEQLSGFVCMRSPGVLL